MLVRVVLAPLVAVVRWLLPRAGYLSLSVVIYLKGGPTNLTATAMWPS
jgi:hypothetical protein